MMFSRALYYPTIDISNERWLKSAALFWDRIETIVPHSLERSPYHNKTTNALYDKMILVPHVVDPWSSDVEGLENDVRMFIKNSKGVQLLFRRKNRRVVDRDKLLDTYGDLLLHAEKLPAFLQNELECLKDENGYFETTPDFMRFYMTLLANNICKRNGLALLTDLSVVNDISNEILKDKMKIEVKPQGNPEELHSALMKMVIENIQINPETPIEKLIAFKAKYSDELGRFRQEMSRLTAYETEVTTYKAIHDQVTDIYNNAVVPSLNDLKRALDGSSIKWAVDNIHTYIISIVLPAVYGLSGIPLGNLFTVGSGLLIGYTLWGSRRSRKELMRNSDYAYLLKAYRTFFGMQRKFERI